MILSLEKADLYDYVKNQLNYFFPDKYVFSGQDTAAAFELALERCEECFKVITLGGYHDNKGNVLFSHLHGDQYATFIYYLSNSLWNYSENKVLCDKLLALNRALHSIFISYKNNMPEHFVLAHPIGTILGNASYSDYLVVFQGVTVNTSQDDNGNSAPVLGKGLFLAAESRIIGNQPVGDYVSLGVNAMVYQQSIPDNSVVTCKGGNLCNVAVRQKKTCMAQNYFNVQI